MMIRHRGAIAKLSGVLVTRGAGANSRDISPKRRSRLTLVSTNQVRHLDAHAPYAREIEGAHIGEQIQAAHEHEHQLHAWP